MQWIYGAGICVRRSFLGKIRCFHQLRVVMLEIISGKKNTRHGDCGKKAKHWINGRDVAVEFANASEGVAVLACWAVYVCRKIPTNVPTCPTFLSCLVAKRRAFRFLNSRLFRRGEHFPAQQLLRLVRRRLILKSLHLLQKADDLKALVTYCLLPCSSG
ncbi:hypothetical protein GQ457_04G005180 [Hibiscus cannabinus]